jgi:hypothetical protein
MRRTYNVGDCGRIEEAISLLRKARDLAAESGAARAVAKIRRALTSTEGALRHSNGLRDRTAARNQQERESLTTGGCRRPIETSGFDSDELLAMPRPLSNDELAAAQGFPEAKKQ